ENLKKKLKDDYNEWRKTKIAKGFWKQRNLEMSQLNYKNSLSQPQESDSASSSVTTVERIETISFEYAKAIIAEDMRTVHSLNMYSNSLSRFKRDVYESMEAPLTYETHLQHLLALSDIMYIEKKSIYPGLQSYFDEPIETIRQNMYNTFGFKQLNQKFPIDTMMTLINITNDLNRDTMSRIQAESKISVLVIDNTDQIMIRLLQCVKSMVELLPLTNQKKESKEFELCTRYLQPCFQKLLTHIFKWLSTNCFLDADADPNKNRPDGVVENDLMAIGYFEVEPIKHTKNHRKINMDFHRLRTFSKAGTINFNRKHMFQIMAV
ncbi:uncharacterized protein B0P05DRAFT_436024, partial [Gilbertella persicaria]|uniref:uncharacterized protein n=1 Tax=Gilbertella persicaria TaxID=101096 RepID=UPI00221E3ABC